jgi:hypothetical protein
MTDRLTVFWIVSTSMTALLMITYGWIKDDRKRKNRKNNQSINNLNKK